MSKRIIYLFVFLFVANELQAQNFYDWKIDRKWIIGFTGGTASYFGELNSSNELEFTQPSALYFTVRRNIWKRIDGRAGIGAFFIRAIDESRAATQPDFRFSGVSYELSAEAIIHLINSKGRYYERTRFDPYITIGVAATYINNKAGGPNGDRIPLRDFIRLFPEIDEENYSPLAVAGIFGAGFNYKLNYLINIGVEGAWRYLSTDYFDNVRNRGSNTNTFNNDWYWIMGFRIETYLPPDFFQRRNTSKGGGKIKFFRKLRKGTYWDN